MEENSIELGAQDYALNAYLDNKQAVVLAVFQRPGSNALTTADAVFELIDEPVVGPVVEAPLRAEDAMRP